MSVTLYHNPKCSKSRRTLELLEEQGITPTIIEYLKSPPTAEQLQEILNLLGFAPRDLMRRKEDVYAECELDNPSLTDEELMGFMVKHPILIERPIVLANGKAAIGRPPEQVLEILHQAWGPLAMTRWAEEAFVRKIKILQVTRGGSLCPPGVEAVIFQH